jgi:hypothetical protein
MSSRLPCWSNARHRYRCARGVKTKTALFTMRLSFSGRAAHKCFLTQGQEGFLDGHVHAFERLGGYVGVNTAVWAEAA